MVAMTAVSGDAQATSIKTPTLGSFEVKSVLDVEQSFSASGSSAGLADDGAPLETPLDPSSAEWVRHLPPTEINKLDLGTPDAWVPRHPDLIRLTGRHPFNCEPTPEALYDNGYITPSNLHYVRNHGAVPRIRWEDHRLEIKGAVGKPTVFTMDQILTFPTVTVTCTLTCAGNRRKEQNMHKKTIGFNWGPAGTGCSEWTGVRLSDLLKYCEIKKPSEGAKYVCLNGPKGELPQGTDGSYGTSITHYKVCATLSIVFILSWHTCTALFHALLCRRTRSHNLVL
jgi:nitrate reductase (NAD(P)H)